MGGASLSAQLGAGARFRFESMAQRRIDLDGNCVKSQRRGASPRRIFALRENQLALGVPP